MLHMDSETLKTPPATGICDPVKNETITLWLEETKRKKEAGGEEKVAKKRDSRKNFHSCKNFCPTPDSRKSRCNRGGYFLPCCTTSWVCKPKKNIDF